VACIFTIWSGESSLSCSGFLEFAPSSPWLEILSAIFGVGAGLTLDEFALWVDLKDVYWAEEGRASLDARRYPPEGLKMARSRARFDAYMSAGADWMTRSGARQASLPASSRMPPATSETAPEMLSARWRIRASSPELGRLRWAGYVR
jgi:hypothetical protein